MIELKAIFNSENILGYAGENNTKVLLFSIEKFKKEFPNADYSLVHQRCGDPAPYPCDVSVDDKYVHWTITSSDVAKVGIGKV